MCRPMTGPRRHRSAKLLSRGMAASSTNLVNPVQRPQTYCSAPRSGVSGRGHGAPTSFAATMLQARAWLRESAGTLENVSRLWSAAPPWLPAPLACEGLEFWFCANLWFPDEGLREMAEPDLTASLRTVCPHGLKGKATARVASTVAMLLHVVVSVRSRVVVEEHGRRFGDPLLDALGELVRYAHRFQQTVGGFAKTYARAPSHDCKKRWASPGRTAPPRATRRRKRPTGWLDTTCLSPLQPLFAGSTGPPGDAWTPFFARGQTGFSKEPG